jgi:hypothetical protein
MKNLIFTSIFCLGLTMLTCAQSTPALCDAPDSVKDWYQLDADYLAVNQTLGQISTWKDSARINPQLSDLNMDALLAVYNATGLAARDTVTDKLKIRNYFRVRPLQMYLVVDSSAHWIKQWRNGVFANTGYRFMDSLVSLYPHFTNPITPFLDSTIIVSLEFFRSYNIKALSSIFAQAEGVIYAEQGTMYGDGDSISISFVGNSAIATYSHGWNIPTNFGCYTGCPYRRYWQFQVDLSDCSVQYLGSYGDVLPQNYLSQPEEELPSLSVYPNPFRNVLYVAHVAPERPYQIYSSTGQALRSGRINQGEISDLETLPPGVYLLEIGLGTKTQRLRVLKSNQ